ncbi:MAG: YhjD/YihY/BrkB family envelope integrity protein [Sandaracinaceae bacterium]
MHAVQRLYREATERLFEHAPAQRRPLRFARRTLRVLYLAVRGFLRDDCFEHAGALAFDTLLALVPLVVLIASALRSLGLWDELVTGYVEPWVTLTLGQAPGDQSTVRDAVFKILELGERADLLALGFVGVVALLYLLGVLLVTVETTLNRIFGARAGRGLLRRAADYGAILFVIPLALVLTIALGHSFLGWGGIGWADGILQQAVAVAAVSGVLTFVYLVMPHARCRFRSALLGGVVAGVLWQLGLEAYAALQIGVTRYNALYSSFAALPLLLVWIFVSWLLVLFGAEIAAAHQDEAGYRWRIRNGEPSTRTRHALGVRLVARIARAFVRGESPSSLASMARALEVPPRLAESVLDDLANAHLLARLQDERAELTYVLTCDPRSVRVGDVLAVLDRGRDPYLLLREPPSPSGIDAVLSGMEESRAHSAANITLRELALVAASDRVCRRIGKEPGDSATVDEVESDAARESPSRARAPRPRHPAPGRGHSNPL